jgi:hypothetical protein
LEKVMAVLWNIVEILREIQLEMRGLEEAINGHWVAVKSDEEKNEGKKVEEVELIKELVWLLKEAANYCTFWRVKYRREY